MKKAIKSAFYERYEFQSTNVLNLKDFIIFRLISAQFRLILAQLFRKCIRNKMAGKKNHHFRTRTLAFHKLSRKKKVHCPFSKTSNIHYSLT